VNFGKTGEGGWQIGSWVDTAPFPASHFISVRPLCLQIIRVSYQLSYSSLFFSLSLSAGWTKLGQNQALFLVAKKICYFLFPWSSGHLMKLHLFKIAFVLTDIVLQWFSLSCNGNFIRVSMPRFAINVFTNKNLI
jgi:hypothetical protein